MNNKKRKSIVLPASLKREMLEHAFKELPYEACGVIAGKEGKPIRFYPGRNELKNPYRFNLHPEDHFRILMELEKSGEEMWGIFHSHPTSNAYPSELDIEEAYYPDSYHLIASFLNPYKPELRAFTIKDKQVSEIPLKIEW